MPPPPALTAGELLDWHEKFAGKEIIEPLLDRIIGRRSAEDVKDPAKPRTKMIERNDEIDEEKAAALIAAGITDVKIRPGQKVRLETPGGGGFGEPAAREPERVVRDVKLGYVSRASARRDYKVVLRTDGSLDADATAQARAGR